MYFPSGSCVSVIITRNSINPLALSNLTLWLLSHLCPLLSFSLFSAGPKAAPYLLHLIFSFKPSPRLSGNVKFWPRTLRLWSSHDGPARSQLRQSTRHPHQSRRHPCHWCPGCRICFRQGNSCHDWQHQCHCVWYLYKIWNGLLLVSHWIFIKYFGRNCWHWSCQTKSREIPNLIFWSLISRLLRTPSVQWLSRE